MLSFRGKRCDKAVGFVKEAAAVFRIRQAPHQSNFEHLFDWFGLDSQVGLDLEVNLIEN